MATYMHPIYTQIVGSGGAASVTFNNIPQSYKDLRIFLNTKDARAIVPSDILVRFNGDTGSNYSLTYALMRGDNLGFQAENRINQNNPWWGLGNGTVASTANMFGGNEMHILDYRGAHFKNVYTYGGAIASNEVWPYMSYGVWRSTAAITSITLTPLAPNFVQGSTFTLYGLQDNLAL